MRIAALDIGGTSIKSGTWDGKMCIRDRMEAGSILNVQIEHEVENLGKDQMQNFFYTYIMIFALYMVILLYGQMVATNVATEKSSRACLLYTSRCV